MKSGTSSGGSLMIARWPLLLLCGFLLTGNMFFFPAPRLQAQPRGPARPRLLSVEALHEDVQKTRSLLEEMHPGLHLYVTSGELARQFDAVSASIDRPLTPAQFLVKLAPPIESIRCGHTYLMPPPAQVQMSQRRGRLFPLPILFIEGVAVVDHKKASLPLGAVILAINDISMEELAKQLQPLVPCDGFVASSRLTNLAVEFADAYAIALGQPRSFHVRYRLHGTEELLTRSLEPVDGRRLDEFNETRFSHGGESYPLDFEHPRKDTVLMTINSLDFDDYRRGDGMFRSYLKRSFAAIARNPRVTNLVLDLRRNDGGYTDHEIRLHSYLASDPFHEMRTSETRTLTIADKHLLDPDWYSRGLTRYMERRLAKEFDPAGEDLFTVDDDFNPVHQPHRHHFKGTLYVLTSGRTHSAAASLCSMLDRDGPTIFVGEETGGVRTSFTAGNILGYLLPNSRVQLAIPIIQYHFLEQPGQEAGRGVIPDHPVARTRVDFVTNKDRALERVLQLIDKATSN
jgi:hypothetical protein